MPGAQADGSGEERMVPILELEDRSTVDAYVRPVSVIRTAREITA
ncbi:MAG: hypothetical protein WKF75_11520 [Singulisphaera sp.]